MTEAPSTSRDKAAIADHVERLFRESAGQDRLEGELRRLAQDILGTEADLPDPACREVVQKVSRAAVAASVEPLVARFIAEIARGIGALPPEMRRRILAGTCRHDLGMD